MMHVLARRIAQHEADATPGPTGTTACPIFLFDVAGSTATLAGPGATCNSGPGTLTPRSGSFTSSGDHATLTALLVIDAQEPSNTGLVHCVITVSGVCVS